LQQDAVSSVALDGSEPPRGGILRKRNQPEIWRGAGRPALQARAPRGRDSAAGRRAGVAPVRGMWGGGLDVGVVPQRRRSTATWTS